MKIRRLISLVLTIPLAAGLLAGCGSKTDDGSNNNSEQTEGKGGYTEKEIKLPEEGSQAIGMFWKDDKLTVYMKDERNTPAYQSYTYEDHTWSQPQEEQWLEDASQQLKGTRSEIIRLGKDGKVYEETETASEDVVYGSHIFTSSDDGTKALDITPEELLKVDGDGTSERFTDFDVFGDGTLALACMSNDLIKFYRDGKKTDEIEGQFGGSERIEHISLSDQTAAMISEDKKNIDFYNQENLEKSGSVKVDFIEDDLEYIHLAPGTDKNWFFVDPHGIHRIQEDGKFVETVFNAKNGMMGLTGSEVRDFSVKDDNFYILYQKGDDNDYHLEEYVYDDETSNVRSKSLSIYGLRQSETVSQAVQEFQRSHSDVNIDYKSATGAEESPSSDDIRNLNAELLNKQGADLLILDGLPLDSYVEKGILSDITDLSGPLKEEGVLMDVIGNTASKGKSVYALPARLSVPYVYGTDEEKDSVQSLDALHAYVEKDPDQPLFGVTTHEFLGRTLFFVMYDEIIEKDGSVNEKKLSELLSDWIQICKTSKASEMEQEMGEEKIDLKQAGIDFQSGFSLFGDRFASIEEGRGLNSIREPFSRMEQKGVGYDSIKQLYIPKVIIGVNAASKNQELAKEFIQSMYSDSVQNIDTSEGFPVTENALQYLADYVETAAAKNDIVGTSAVNPFTGTEEKFDAHYPDKVAVEQINTKIKGLKKPFRPDDILTDTVMKEMENCYAGTKTPEETAQGISQKVDTYLQE